MTALRLFAGSCVFVVFSMSGLFGQRVGQTRTVTVPFRSEAWSSTATRTIPSRRSSVTVSAPRHLATEQARSGASSQAASSGTADTSLIAQVFPGPADEVPPDSDIAAGPNHLVATVNAVIAIYDKQGKLISQTEATSFFGSVSGPGCCFDLRVLYDQTNSRFIVAAAQTNYSAPSSQLVIAVSATSDPTGTWNKYAVDVSNVFWSDFPTIATSATALYITADRIPFTPGPAGWNLTVIQMPELLAGTSNLRITDFSNIKAPSGQNVLGPIVPAITYGASDQEYLVSNGPPGTMYVFSVSTSDTPTLNSAKLTTAAYPAPPLAPQPGSSVGLGVGGDGIFTAVWRNGSLWVAQSVGSGPASPGTNAIVRWYEIDPVTPAVRQFGSVTGAGDAYIPALTVRPDGQVDVVYTTSSTTQFASAGYAHRNPTDPPNTMPVSGVYKAGDSTYPLSRWGDISGISVDPDGSSSWGIAEYAVKGSFATSIIQIRSGAVATPSLSLSVTPASATVTAGQPATFTVSVAGQALTAPVTLACSQGVPSDADCTFSPTAVSPGTSAALTISTKPRGTALLRRVLSFSFLAFFVVLVGRRSSRFGALLCLVLLAGLISCGGVGKSSNNSGGGNGNGSGGGGGTSGTPAGTYAITVTGTSGAVTGSAQVSLTVQ